MAYRKIEVDGKSYEYSIGKTHTKVRHVGVWKNEEVGAIRVYDDRHTFRPIVLLQVTPKDLAWFIRSGKFRVTEKCKKI